MTKQKKHISEKDFQRYLADQMTDAERNAFERELQKYPFEAEALEGFQQISPEELSDDLQELKAKLFSEKRKIRYRFWAAAATLLLLVTTGILWFQLKNNNPVPVVTENEVTPKTEEKAAQSEEKPVEPSQPEREKQGQTMTAPEAAKVEEPEIKTEPAQTKKAVPKAAETKAVKTPPKPQTSTLHIVENQAQIQNEISIDTNSIANMRFQDKLTPQNNSVSLGKTERFAKSDKPTTINDKLVTAAPAVSALTEKSSTISNVNLNDTEKNMDAARTRANAISNIKFDQSPPTVDTNKIFGTNPLQ